MNTNKKEICPGSGHYISGVGGYSARALGPSACCPVCGKNSKLTKRSTIRQHKRKAI